MAQVVTVGKGRAGIAGPMAKTLLNHLYTSFTTHEYKKQSLKSLLKMVIVKYISRDESLQLKHFLKHLLYASHVYKFVLPQRGSGQETNRLNTMWNRSS